MILLNDFSLFLNISTRNDLFVKKYRPDFISRISTISMVKRDPMVNIEILEENLAKVFI